jgi:hypothetical protein
LAPKSSGGSQYINKIRGIIKKIITNLSGLTPKKTSLKSYFIFEKENKNAIIEMNIDAKLDKYACPDKKVPTLVSTIKKATPKKK